MKTNYSIFNTGSNNYIYSPRNKQFLLLSPLLCYMLLLKRNGIDLSYWIKTVRRKIEIENIGIFPRKEIYYQYKKYLFLLENQYFETNNYALNEYTGTDIKRFFSNTRNITFEVTEKCNLACEYCIYGKYYTTKRIDKGNDLNFTTAKKILDFFFTHWNSDMNSSYNKKISIGFYGGEALLNFPLIKEIVTYVKKYRFLLKMRLDLQ